VYTMLLFPSHDPLDDLLETFTYARRRYNVTQFVIDSLVCLGISIDDFDAQAKAIAQLAAWKKKHRVHVHLVAHSRKGEDESKVPGKMDVRGSGSITDLVDNMLTVWRNKKREQAKEEGKHIKGYDVIISCDKQRNGKGWEGLLGLTWIPEAFQLVDTEESAPRIYHKPDTTDVPF